LKSEQANSSLVENLKEQLNFSRFSLNIAKYEANRHFDAIEMDIDIQAETLIALIHEKRNQMLESIKTLRKKTDSDFDSITDQHFRQYSELEENLNLTISRLEANCDLIEKDLNQIACNFNKIQRSIENVRSGTHRFVANPVQFDSTLLGVFLNKKVEQIFSKVQNLKLLLDDETNISCVELHPSSTEQIHRQYIVPLSQERTIGINFTSTRCINLDLFDETGSIIKSVPLASNASYYPIYSSTSDKLVISYLDERSVTNIILFDSNLNQLKASRLQNLIESIYMNNKNIVCTFVHKSSDISIVLNFELNSVGTFGQKLDADKPFFYDIIEDTKDFRSKKNLTVFGFNESRIYLYNTIEMVLMCSKTGTVLNTVKKKPSSYFIIDSNENILEVDTISKEILFRSMDMSLNTSSRYQIAASSVFLVEDQFISFVDSKSKKLTYV